MSRDSEKFEVANRIFMVIERIKYWLCLTALIIT